MPRRTHGRIARKLANRGYNADREAVTLLAGAPEPDAALERTVEAVPDDALVLTAEHVRTVLADGPRTSPSASDPGDQQSPDANGGGTHMPPEDNAVTRPGGDPDRPPGRQASTAEPHPSVSGGAPPTESIDGDGTAPVEAKGSDAREASGEGGSEAATPRHVAVTGDVTGRSTGTGEYEDYVSVFRDRFQRLSALLRGRVNHRPTEVVASMPGGSEAAIVGMVADLRSTAGGHRLVELEDTTGTFPCLVLDDREIAAQADELLLDEVIAVEGTLADDGGVLFVDSLHFPDVPRTHAHATADRHVRAVLVSDLHVGSHEFLTEEWSAFADWLHSEAAEAVEYLLIAGDMVEGVGVYPDQDEELDVEDIYAQYERFAERLKEVPGDLEIVMIPGNHDAVRLAEPQPGFDEELRSILSAHDARVHGNPSTVTVEGVSVLMYHGVSLDEVIAALPDGQASYQEPHRAMFQLLRKRHLAPQFGGHTRLAPEERDYLVIEEVPDVFHAGHTHTFGIGKYRDVLTVNSGCWQAQTAFQRSVNIDPDAALAPVVDLDTLDVEVMSF